MQTFKTVTYIFFVIAILTTAVAQNREQAGTNQSKKSLNGSTQPSKRNPQDPRDCPVKVPVKPDGYDVVTPTFVPQAKANLVRSTNTMKMNIIEIKDIKLNIPAFKQFKNNRTDFTEDGEEEFKLLIAKLGYYLETDNHGKPFVLKITGSASQIPTSFDPSKPNNNLRKDGGSIYGKTSIENNKMLAKARADELGKKIKAIFPKLNIVTPTLEEIKLGETPWTPWFQNRLVEATKTRKREEIDKVFAPFQKDQWVKLESGDITSKTIQPEALKMYMLSTTPSLKTKINGKEETVKTIFLISKTTYDKVGGNHSFGNAGERDRFLRRFNLKIYNWDKDSLNRWYLLSGKHEVEAFNKSSDYDERTKNLYHVGINDNMDQQFLQELLFEELERKYKGEK
ncbi:MAG: hypothetical protein SFY32_04330 [Bacteroidota bacterium]|nr:hypothetical protein [Bacteroidota bacterium]